MQFLASGPDVQLLSQLESLIAEADSLEASIAFLSKSDWLTDWIKGDQKRRLRIIVQLQYPTSRLAIEKIQKEKRADIRGYPGDLSPALHEKILLAMRNGKPIGAYVGSANSTHAGLTRNYESGLWVTENPLLIAIKNRIHTSWRNAVTITKPMLENLDIDRDYHRKAVQKATLEAEQSEPLKWSNLRTARYGEFLIKQNGLSSDYYYEGEEVLLERYAAQTFSKVSSTFSIGLGVLITWIARRKDGSPDRLIYGRGRIDEYDKVVWRLPQSILYDSMLSKESRLFVNRWPFIVWMNPVEFIDYPPDASEYLWLSEMAGLSTFRYGWQWISRSTWTKCNTAFDKLKKLYGLRAVDKVGIWWNDELGLKPTDERYLDRIRIEQLNTS